MIELLARLNNSGKFPDGSLGGGTPVISNEDIAGACKGLTKHAHYYALVKINGDKGALVDLRRLHYDAIKHRAAVEGWKSDTGRLAMFSALSLMEGIEPRMCSRCHGSGLQQNQKPCQQCKGHPFLGANGAKCADMMGITRSAWAKTWAPRMDDVLSDFLAFEDIVNRHLRRQLRDTG